MEITINEEEIFATFQQQLQRIVEDIFQGKHYDPNTTLIEVPYGEECCFFQGLTKRINNLRERVPAQTASSERLERIIENISKEIPPEEELGQMRTIVEQAERYMRRLIGYAERAYDFNDSLSWIQGALPERLRKKNREEAIAELSRISRMRITRDNLSEFNQMLTYVSDNYLFSAFSAPLSRPRPIEHHPCYDKY